MDRNSMQPLYCLHGFLGRPSDWDCFQFDSSHGVNLYSLNSMDDKTGIILGYSLGGRIALQTIFQNPSAWKGAILISTHPGLQSREEKQARLLHDQEWARRFREDSWESLMQDWERQPVFYKSKVLERSENDFNREDLALTLEKRSLGHQADFRPLIEKLNIPILWLVGEHDQKYRAIVPTNLGSHPQSRSIVIPGAGHRVPWDQPDLFKKYVHEFRIFS